MQCSFFARRPSQAMSATRTNFAPCQSQIQLQPLTKKVAMRKSQGFPLFFLDFGFTKSLVTSPSPSNPCLDKKKRGNNLKARVCLSAETLQILDKKKGNSAQKKQGNRCNVKSKNLQKARVGESGFRPIFTLLWLLARFKHQELVSLPKKGKKRKKGK